MLCHEKGATLSMPRSIPFDHSIKSLLSIGHIFSFSVYFGGTIAGADMNSAKLFAIGTGIFLAARELYKDGWRWLARTDGLCTLLKTILIATDDIFSSWKPLMLSVVVLLGAMSAHLPDTFRKKYWV